MQTEGTALALVGLIYDAATDAAQWKVFLEQLGRSLRIPRCFFYVHDFGRREVSIQASVGFDAAHVQSYENYYAARNPTLLYGHEHLWPGNVCPTRMLCRDEVFTRSEFYQEWAMPQGIGHGVAATVLRTPSLVGLFGLLQDIGDPPPDEQDLTLLRDLMPHLQRAIRLHVAITQLQHREQVERDALDRWNQGIVLLDQSARVIWFNQAAKRLLDCADGLSLERDRLRVARASESDQLNALVRDTLTGKLTGPNPQGVITISRARSAHALTLSMYPVSTHRTVFPEPQAACVIFVSDPDSKPLGGEGLLQRVYGLTRAESRVALLLAQGDDVSRISDKLKVRPDTTRIHLKRIFDKTQTKRQADLMRLLISGPLSLRFERQTDR